jgi:hypothetical protein
MTGDQCAICENPLGDDAKEMLDDGEILRVCGACALQREPGGPNQADGPSVIAEAEARSKTVQELLSCRVDAQSQLEEIGQFIENLARAVTHWQDLAAEFEQRSRELEGEVRRLRERLQRAEGLLSAQPTKSASSGSAGHEPAGAWALPSDEMRTGLSPSSAPATLPPPHFPEAAPRVDVASGFEVEDLRLAQRLFSESSFTEKTRSVRRSLGKPIVNLTAVAGPQRRILATVAWEIVWYQYLINLDESVDQGERVTLYGEGMQLEELPAAFRERNAVLDDEGRIDASELEFSLLGENAEIIDDRSPEQAALEDATEEIWDKHSAPEFRWDD